MLNDSPVRFPKLWVGPGPWKRRRPRLFSGLLATPSSKLGGHPVGLISGQYNCSYSETSVYLSQRMRDDDSQLRCGGD